MYLFSSDGFSSINLTLSREIFPEPTLKMMPTILRIWKKKLGPLKTLDLRPLSIRQYLVSEEWLWRNFEHIKGPALIYWFKVTWKRGRNFSQRDVTYISIEVAVRKFKYDTRFIFSSFGAWIPYLFTGKRTLSTNWIITKANFSGCNALKTHQIHFPVEKVDSLFGFINVKRYSKISKIDFTLLWLIENWKLDVYLTSVVLAKSANGSCDK